MASPQEIAEFRIFFPEFSNVTDFPDLIVGESIDEAKCDIDSETFGKKFNNAVRYLAAHFLYIRTQTTSGDVVPTLGALEKIRAGDVDVGLHVSGKFYDNSDDLLLLQTQYGARFVSIRNSVTIHIFTYATIIPDGNIS